MTDTILDDQRSTQEGRRRDLLPKWMKVFCWIFMIFFAFVPVGIILGLLGFEFSLALYGIETTKPFSLVGVLILFLFAIKGVVSVGLWTEKAWAVQLAKLDGVLGIIICVFIMFVLPVLVVGNSVSLRLELAALIPCFMKMREIKSTWEAIEGY